MEGKVNPVQEYINEIDEVRIPDDEKGILAFLSSLESKHQKEYLSFILSQSHIYDGMTEILGNYHHNSFYNQAGYYERYGDKVPKLDKDGKVYFETMTPHTSISNACIKILESLQTGDKEAWNKFAEYVKRIYEPDKMDIYRNNALGEFNSTMMAELLIVSRSIIDNDRLKASIEEDKNKPVELKTGFLSGIRNFFLEARRKREINKKESKVQDDDKLIENALKVIEKYKNDPRSTIIMKEDLELAEKLIKAGLPKEDLLNILTAVGRSVETSSECNFHIFKVVKQLSNNARLAKELYSPEIVYANSFQEMTKNIRLLLIKNSLGGNIELTTEYRKTHLKSQLNAREDVGNVLKGKDLSKDEIQEKMEGYDKEFEEILKEQDPESYVRRSTELMMKFISTHPYDDGNGRTSRMLLQTMLARRGILLPSNIDNYFERGVDTAYTKMEDRALRTEDYTKMCDYMVERVKRFNGGNIEFNEEPLIFDNKEKQREENRSLE